MGQKFGYLSLGCNCPQPCTDCEQDEGCKYPSFTDCVTYNNGYLPNIGLPVDPETTATLTEIIKAIDEKIGELASGTAVDWNTYDTACLAPITTQKQFVEKISLQFCNLKSDYTTFTTTTYPGDISDINTRIDNIVNPELTSAGCLAISSTDTLTQIENKIISKVEDICESLDLSSIVWDSCITSSTTPSTVKEGFEEVLDQICVVKDLTVTGGDTYQVKVSSADTTPDYISNKIITDDCLSAQVTGDNKLRLGLSFTPSIYSFDENYFEVTTGVQESCGQNIQVTLKDVPGGGSVSSVAVDSEDLVVTGSPITSSGTISINLDDIIASPGNFNNVTVNSKGLVTSGSLINYLTTETDPTVPSWVKSITQTDIDNWNNNTPVTLNPATTTVLGGIKVGDGLYMDANDALNTSYSQGYGIAIDSNFVISLTNPVQTSLSKADTALQNISGYITAGANVSISGAGTSASPYEISASGGSGGTGTVTSISAGDGMDFTTITNTGSVTLGTPSTITLSSTNSLTGDSHTHEFNPGGTAAQYIRGDGTLGTLPSGGQEIDGNSYNYAETITSYDGFNTQGGFGTEPAGYTDATGTGIQVNIPANIYQLVIDGDNETTIIMPDPALFPGRELKIKLRNINNQTILSGGVVYNFDTQVQNIKKTEGVSLRFIAGNSVFVGSPVWEIMEVSELNTSLLA